MSDSDNLNKYKPASENFEFREYPFYWVMRLGSRYTQTMEIQLKKVNMNITSWRIGLILRENGTLSMTEVAKHAVGRLPTITKSVYKMQERGWVDVKQSEKDGRVTMVGITDKGLETINTVIGSTSKTIDRAFDGLNKNETDQLNILLQKVFNNLADD
ncbi:MAG: MarR family transcriptional regulator [Arenicella sp.]|nr:MarR family transcriptional regulator [Arenicella sp.]